MTARRSVLLNEHHFESRGSMKWARSPISTLSEQASTNGTVCGGMRIEWVKSSTAEGVKFPHDDSSRWSTPLDTDCSICWVDIIGSATMELYSVRRSLKHVRQPCYQMHA